MSNALKSFCCRAGGLDGSCDDSTKFAVFRDNRDYRFSRKRATLSNHLKPNGGFVQFLKDYLELVNEVGAAFGTARFTVVGGGSGSGPQNLTAYVPTLRRSGQLR